MLPLHHAPVYDRLAESRLLIPPIRISAAHSGSLRKPETSVTLAPAFTPRLYVRSQDTDMALDRAPSLTTRMTSLPSLVPVLRLWNLRFRSCNPHHPLGCRIRSREGRSRTPQHKGIGFGDRLLSRQHPLYTFKLNRWRLLHHRTRNRDLLVRL